MKRALAMLLTLILCVGCAPAGMRTVGALSAHRTGLFPPGWLLEWNGKEYSGSMVRDAQGVLSLVLTGESLILPVSFACGLRGLLRHAGGAFSEPQRDGSPLVVAALIAAARVCSAGKCKNKAARTEFFLRRGRVRLICDSESLAFSDLVLEGGRIEFTEFAFTDPEHSAFETHRMDQEKIS